MNTATTETALRDRFASEIIQAVEKHEIYRDAHAALKEYTSALTVYAKPGDRSMLGRIELPIPYAMLMAPEILYGFFRMWLRREGVDPDSLSD